MLGVISGLELPQILLTERRNSGDTEEETESDLSNDTSNSGVLMESMKIESRPCLKSSTSLSGNSII